MENKQRSEILNSVDYAISGAVSGAVTRALCQPLDVLKIRFQLQIEPLSKQTGSKYWSMFQASKAIVKEEGIAALWKGHVPAQLLSILYGITQFASFEMLLKQLSGSQNLPHAHFVCGSAAGCLATIASFPCDVLRTRLVAQGEPKVYHGIGHATYEIYTKEGIRSFFKGLSPTLIQIAPHTGAQFALYAVFKELWKALVADETVATASNLVPVSLTGSLVCGTLAGLGAKTFIFPLDVARKRLQVQGFEEARRKFGKVFQCQGLLNCLWITLSEEGIRGLYKGLYPSLVKAGATTALHFTVYEQACKILASYHTN